MRCRQKFWVRNKSLLVNTLMPNYSIIPTSNFLADLDVIHDSYEPSSLSFFDHMFGFFSGVRQKGFQTTEEILREGSFITAIGELELDDDIIRLQPTNFGPMFVTTATKNTLIRKFEEAKTSMM